MMKTTLKEINSIVLSSTRNRLDDPHVIVPLPGDVYDDLWAVLPPVDRFEVTAELMNYGIAHLCSGPTAPVYVRVGYQPGAGDSLPVQGLPLAVLSEEDQRRVVERLAGFFSTHPWLSAPTPSRVNMIRFCAIGIHQWFPWAQYTIPVCVSPGIIASKAIQGQWYNTEEVRECRTCQQCGKMQDRIVRE